jgi:hypothetical protein
MTLTSSIGDFKTVLYFLILFFKITLSAWCSVIERFTINKFRHKQSIHLCRKMNILCHLQLTRQSAVIILVANGTVNLCIKKKSF